MSNSVQFYLPIPVLLPNYILEPRLQLSPDKQCSRYPLNTRFGSVKSAYCLLLITLIFFSINLGLKRECGNWLGGYIDQETVLQILRTARLFRLPRLEDACTEYLARNIDQVYWRMYVHCTEYLARNIDQVYWRMYVHCTRTPYTVHCTLYSVQCSWLII